MIMKKKRIPAARSARFPRKESAGKSRPVEHRKLAAIMFTDMVGYSALTQKDEKLALRVLEEHRAMIRPLLMKHDGHEIKTIGDAFLVEFPSALAATSCAIEIQKTLFERKESHPGNFVQLRIGLHMGDVIYKERDVFGDGVNIAARIEPLAEPGGICLSEDVARQIHNKIDYALIRLGTGELKNINLPVGIYRIIRPWEKRRLTILEQIGFALGQKKIRRGLAITLVLAAVAAILLWRSSSPRSLPFPANRVAVLPFVNINPDARDEYFADGMTEELISSLSKIHDLNVIARTSVAKYRGSAFDISEIGNALRVGTILEGSVRTSGDEARISINLVDVESQKTILSREYTRLIKDIFAIQSDIAQSITGALSVQLLRGEKESIEKSGTENSEAYRHYLLGRFHLSKRTGEEVVKAIEYFTLAAGQDSTFALAFAGLAECYTLAGNAGYASLPRKEAIVLAKRYAATAISLDNSQAEAHASLAYVKFRIDWDWAGAEQEFQRAIALKPGYARAHEWYALFLSIIGHFDDALKEMIRAGELDPLSASVSNGIGRIYHFRREFDLAEAQFRKTIEMDPAYAEAHFSLGMTYIVTKRYNDALRELEVAARLSGNRPVIRATTAMAYAYSGRTKEARSILAEFTRPGGSAYLSAMILAALGEVDRSMTYLERALRERDGILIYLNPEPLSDVFLGLPRYRELTKAMGLTPPQRKSGDHPVRPTQR
jgi:class 3 adenylate cyclase/TolB-like protein/Flp pilus assembly protein TadD